MKKNTITSPKALKSKARFTFRRIVNRILSMKKIIENDKVKKKFGRLTKKSQTIQKFSAGTTPEIMRAKSKYKTHKL